MTNRALLLGLNYRGMPYELHGCIRDAYNMEVCLQSRGFTDITLLSDDTAITPTARSITRAIQKLTSSAVSGDIVVIHYSGHGSLVPDVSGDETNDSALFTLDGVFFIDDDLRELLNHFVAGVKVLVLLDCCHNGTGADLRYVYSDRSYYIGNQSRSIIGVNTIIPRSPSPIVRRPIKPVLKDVPIFVKLRGKKVVGLVRQKHNRSMGRVPPKRRRKPPPPPLQPVKPVITAPIPMSPPTMDSLKTFKESQWMIQQPLTTKTQYAMTSADIVVISGCADPQTSAEDLTPQGVQGAFTRAFIDALSVAQGASWKRVLLAVSAILSMRKYTQTPQLSCGNNMSLDANCWI
jgi:hypothetical protein